jgi:hypothetical protein
VIADRSRQDDGVRARRAECPVELLGGCVDAGRIDEETIGLSAVDDLRVARGDEDTAASAAR